MNMKKILSFSLLGLVVILVVATFLQPTNFTVEDSIVINKERASVVGYISNLKEWKAWSPWYERDPEMKMEYGEVFQGRGASVTWESKSEGNGKQTIVDMVGEEFMKLKLEFYTPFTGEADAFFKLDEVSSDQTKVTWRMKSENKGFVDKFFYFVFSVSSAIKKDFTKGLSNLKEVAES